MKNKKIAGLIAFLLSLFIHSMIFSVPAYLYYIKYGKSEKSVEQNSGKVFTIDASIIPDIKVIGSKTAVKKDFKEEKENLKTQEIGVAEKKLNSVYSDDALDSEMLVIYDYIKRKIQENKKYPYQAKKERIEGVVEMQFSIAGDGVLKNVNIVRSSGHIVLDEEALATIQRAAPYPAIKDRLNTDNLQLSVKLIYKIE